MNALHRILAKAALSVYIVATLAGADAWSAEPTLARLTFWVPPERQAELAAVFDRKVLPILKQQGLVESSEKERPTVEGAFTRLFEAGSPAEVLNIQSALETDPRWVSVLAEFEKGFGPIRGTRTYADPHLDLAVYRAPAGPGRKLQVGPGRSKRLKSGIGPWHTIQKQGRIPGKDVTAIFQARDRNLWFGTDAGIVRFDGFAYETFTTEDGLASDYVKCIAEDREGNIWVGTGMWWHSNQGGGASCYDGSRWVNYDEKDGLAGRDVAAIFQDSRGMIWFGTEKGLSRFDPSSGSWETFTTDDGLAHNRIRAILEDRAGHIWVGAGDNYWYEDNVGGISRFDGEHFTTYNKQDGLAGNTVTCILQDRDGYLWFGTDAGVSRLDPRRWVWKSFTEQDGLGGRTVVAATEDHEGNLWFCSIMGKAGIARYDGETWTAFTAVDGPKGEWVNSVLGDMDGHLWFGSSDLSRYDGLILSTFPVESGISSVDGGDALYQDRDGNLWFGSPTSTITRYDGETWTTWSKADGLPKVRGGYGTIFQDKEGSMWFGAVQDGGVVQFDGENWVAYGPQHGLAGGKVRGMAHDRDNAIWFATDRGISRLSAGTFTNFTKADGLGANEIFACFQDSNGVLWFGPDRGGVNRYDGQTWTTIGENHALSNQRVVKIRPGPEGTMWFCGMEGGVSRCDGETLSTLSTADGIPDAWFCSILFDRRGHLWIATSAGVHRYDGKVFQALTVEDGLPSNFTNEFLEDRRGDIWIGSPAGVTRFRPGRSTPPGVAIEAVVADRRYEAVADLSLPSTAGLVVFEFRGMSFITRPGGMVYRYRLEGYDEEWTNTRDRRVEYQDLPRGEYTFEVLAVDRDLVYSKTPATVALTVHLSYERIGLLSALGIAVVLIGWQTVRVVRRDRRLQAANTAMSEANKELFQANIALNRERAVERIRGEVQAMERASDFETVLSVLSEDLKAARMSFDTCGIDVLDGTAGEPTMAYFEAHGFRYTTYKLDPEGNVSVESYHISAPFPDVTRETIDRFIAGQSWRGRSEQNAIVEVPVSNYGRLRVTGSDRETFTEEEIETLQDFAGAISLGYARYLDFQELETANREIQEQTERKSAFLASMSHELRSPMNAIIGFTRMVLRRAGEALPDRQKGNLNTVIQSANHLLALINDLLDLSKIEAGRMDVNAEVFNAGKLITSCCAQVEPLVIEKPDVKLTCEVADDIGEANTDQGRLRQILMNLLSNAIKFTDKGEVVVRASKADEQLVVTVSDTGSGIPPDALETVFEEFQQVKGSDPQHKGTGLGLPICKGFAELLGGSIRVESEVGKGSTFTVRIPMIYRES